MKKPRSRFPDLGLDEFKDLDVRAAYILEFGPRCAAWLVNRFRKRARNGGFALHMTASQEQPEWFQIAIGYLKQHAKNWEVDERVERGIRRFRVRWLGGRKVPDVIAPIGSC